MKFRTATVATVSLLICFGCLAVWKFFGRSTPSPPLAAPASTISAAKPNADGLALERDRAVVFQRAFWRRPSADERILHAERREWHETSSGVEKWQWYIALQPGTAFRDWLLNDNPFELVALAPAAELPELSSPPAWFPAPGELVALARYRNREGRYLVFHDPVNNQLFATDSGGGFASARK